MRTEDILAFEAELRCLRESLHCDRFELVLESPDPPSPADAPGGGPAVHEDPPSC